MYEVITLYANTKVDYLMLKSKTAIQDEIDTTFDPNYLPEWEDFDNLEIMAPFTDGLSSSFIGGLTSPMIGYIIFRQKLGDSRLIKVGETSVEINKIIDYAVANATEYRWFVFPVTVTQLGVSLVSDYFKTCWGHWAVIELLKLEEDIYATGEIWRFNGNLEANPVVQNLDQTLFRSYSRFSKYASGDNNYKTLGFSCLLKDVGYSESNYSDTKELKDRWDALVARNEPVLLKDRKGNMYYGLLTNPSGTIDEKPSGLPTTIDVSFTELALPTEFQIFKEVE
jgi:hypothetical protein